MASANSVQVLGVVWRTPVRCRTSSLTYIVTRLLVKGKESSWLPYCGKRSPAR